MISRHFPLKFALLGLLGLSRLAWGSVCGDLLEHSTEARVAYFESHFTDAFRADLVRIAARLTNNHDDAEDVVQESLIRAWSRVDYLMSEPNLRLLSWMRTVLRNVWITRLKRLTPVLILDEYDMESWLTHLPAPSQSNSNSNSEQLTDAILNSDWSRVKRYLSDEPLVVSALNELNPTRRNIFLLRHVVDLLPKEISERLGIQVPTIDVNLYRASAAIRERLQRSSPKE